MSALLLVVVEALADDEPLDDMDLSPEFDLLAQPESKEAVSSADKASDKPVPARKSQAAGRFDWLPRRRPVQFMSFVLPG